MPHQIHTLENEHPEHQRKLNSTAQMLEPEAKGRNVTNKGRNPLKIKAAPHPIQAIHTLLCTLD